MQEDFSFEMENQEQFFFCLFYLFFLKHQHCFSISVSRE